METHQIKIEEKEGPVLGGLLPGTLYDVTATDRVSGNVGTASSYNSMSEAKEAALDYLYEANKKP